MILIVTHKTDFTADYVVNKLNDRNYAYHRFNCEDVLERPNLGVSIDKTHTITQISGVTQFTGVWFRRTMLPEIPDADHAVQHYTRNELESFFSNFWVSIQAERWMSKPHMIYHAENKLLQLQIAKKIGFDIPETLVTGDAEAIRTFYRQCGGDIIVKPIFENRFVTDNQQQLIFTNRVKESDLEQLEKRIALPSLFQKQIYKELEYRVTVVGDKVFVASIMSQSDPETVTDWRRKKLTFRFN